MAVLIKRYQVRYNGVVYGPGQENGPVLVGLSEEEEARLIAGSNGTIEKYVPIVIEEKHVLAEDPKQAKVKKESKESVDESDPEKEIIPEINPEELIKPGKNTENKGKKA